MSEDEETVTRWATPWVIVLDASEVAAMPILGYRSVWRDELLGIREDDFPQGGTEFKVRSPWIHQRADGFHIDVDSITADDPFEAIFEQAVLQSSVTPSAAVTAAALVERWGQTAALPDISSVDATPAVLCTCAGPDGHEFEAVVWSGGLVAGGTKHMFTLFDLVAAAFGATGKDFSASRNPYLLSAAVRRLPVDTRLRYFPLLHGAKAASQTGKDDDKSKSRRGR